MPFLILDTDGSLWAIGNAFAEMVHGKEIGLLSGNSGRPNGMSGLLYPGLKLASFLFVRKSVPIFSHVLKDLLKKPSFFCKPGSERGRTSVILTHFAATASGYKPDMLKKHLNLLAIWLKPIILSRKQKTKGNFYSPANKTGVPFILDQ